MDLSQKYTNKNRNKLTSVPLIVTPTLSVSLIPSDIKSNIPGKNAIVSHSGQLMQHINLLNVLYWEVQNVSLIISTVDSNIPIILTFLSTDLAIEAEIRFTNIKNGAILN